MYHKFKQLDQSNAPVPDILNSGFVLSQECSETYRIHVQQSSLQRASRFRDILVDNRQCTKIQIKGFHVTKGEFVDSLCSRGEVYQNLMGLCCVAIMCDWETRSKIILDQGTIVELMKDGSVCDHMLLACRFTKLRIEDVELIYLPILSGKHWILAVVDIVKEITKFYDSLLAVTDGAHPHKELWKNLSNNLERVYCLAVRKSVHIFFFECQYPENSLQTNMYHFYVLSCL